jgi:nicotinate-nucleotide adenylyltransferase
VKRRALLRSGFGLSPGMRVGLLGGSFNPAHEGHAHVARTALARLGLDRVVWLVSPQNPLKHEGAAALAERMAGARRFAGGGRMVVSDVESRLGLRYTVDLIRVLRARYPAVRFVWLMGADNLAGFHRWRGWREIMRLVPVCVIARPGWEMRGRMAPAARRFASARRPASEARRLALARPPAWVYLVAPLKFASSTEIRARVRASADGKAPDRPAKA